VLDILKSEKLADNAAKIGNYMLNRFQEMAEKHELIGDVRGKGLMIGIELVKDQRTKEPAREERKEMMKTAFERGLILLGAGASSLRLAPPLILTKEQADVGLDIFERTLKEIEQHKR
jgi:4-aminobutyrate aminotransferase